MRDFRTAEEYLAHASQANTRAANAWFLRGYIVWKQKSLQQAAVMLTATRAARGPDWKPAGTVLEGDVRQRMYSEAGFLSVFEKDWDGKAEPQRAYATLDAHLRAIH